MDAAIGGLEVHFSLDLVGGDAAVFGYRLEVGAARDVDVVAHRPGVMTASRGTFGPNLSAIGENPDLASDRGRRRIVIGTRLDPRHDLDVATVLADERHPTVRSAIYGDPGRGRDAVGPYLAEMGAVTVPVAFTVVAPAFGALVGLRGGYGSEQKQRKEKRGVKGAAHGRVSGKSPVHWMRYAAKALRLVISAIPATN